MESKVEAQRKAKIIDVALLPTFILLTTTMSEIDAIFGLSKASGSGSSTLNTSTSKLEKRKRKAEATDSTPSSSKDADVIKKKKKATTSKSDVAPPADGKSKSKPRPPPAVVHDPSAASEAATAASKPKKGKKKATAAAPPDDLASFTSSRGLDDSRKRTEEGYRIYTEEELGLNSTGGGDTPLCPFDCNCCELAGPSSHTTGGLELIALLLVPQAFDHVNHTHLAATSPSGYLDIVCRQHESKRDGGRERKRSAAMLALLLLVLEYPHDLIWSHKESQTRSIRPSLTCLFVFILVLFTVVVAILASTIECSRQHRRLPTSPTTSTNRSARSTSSIRAAAAHCPSGKGTRRPPARR